MTHKKYSPGRIRICLLFAVALALSIPASAEWKEKVLYSFQGGTNDGSVPIGSLVFDKQGNIYGALEFYGPGSCAPQGNACGAVYQLTPPAQKGDAWKETLIYEFQGKGANDGELPAGGLLIDAEGNLYGVTAYGGTGNCTLLGVAAGCGTVFELSPPKQKGGAWTETILYSFPTMKQGYFPGGSVVFDKAGNLYGATSFGGTKGTTCDPYYGGQCGVVFEISPPKHKGGAWTQKVLHDFPGTASGKQDGDGAEPNGGLVLDSKGTIYGTSYFGGNGTAVCGSIGCGTVFSFTPPTKQGGVWTEKIIHRFSGQDGGEPSSGVILGTSGTLYGTTLGGIHGYGCAYELTPSTNGKWKETVLYTFTDDQNGAWPEAAFVRDSTGNLYATAYNGGGESQNGNTFKLSHQKNGKWSLAVLHGFADGIPDGEYPAAPLIFDKAGNLYSTTQDGGSGTNCRFLGCGTVFEVSP
jgi:hypothetical protein